MDYIVDKSILIIPNIIKKNILKKVNQQKELYDIKYYSLEEFISHITFSFSKEALYYLVTKYKIKPEVAKVYLNNIKYVDSNKKYDNTKLKFLSEIKKELDDNNLLIYDPLFKNLIQDKQIIVYGYDYIDKYAKNELQKLNAKIIEKSNYDFKHTIYEFNQIDDEVEFVANKIIDLINDGVNINNIKISGISSEYDNVIKRIFGLYNIPIELNNNTSIIDTNIIKTFLNLIDENTIEEVFIKLKELYNMDIEENNYIYNKLIDLINEYNFADDFKTIKDLIIYELKNIKNYKQKLENKIEIIDLKNNIIDDDKYIFLMSFNQGQIPVMHKDEDYITDSMKNEVEKETTKELNISEKNIVKNNLKSIKNLIITYKFKTPSETYYKSSLIDELEFTVEKGIVENKYSNKINYYKLGNKLDDLIKYGTKDKDLSILYNNYNDINYLKFNNKYKGINTNDLKEYLNNKLLLSYSSVDNYYRCGFRYYLNNILKITEFESTFAQEIGNIFHFVLSKCFEDNFDFEKEFNESIKDLTLTISDRFFLKKLKKELIFVIDTIKKQNNLSSFREGLYENKVYINKNGDIKLTFMGIIDKLLYKKENGNTYLVIIDYKTGTLHTNLNNTIYGIGMQLPVYLYLSDNIDKFENAKVIGFYLQKILNNEITKVSGKTYEKQKIDNLKLDGYSINEEYLIEKIDSTYENSEMIKSMRMSSKGFYAYTKLISEEEIQKLKTIVENNINNAFDSILNADFDINPKRIGKDLVGCEFCKYRDICYLKEEDIVNLEEHKDLDFIK